jgi:GT2 family glycosyltransferase
MAPEIRITVAIPTLVADSNLVRCIRSLEAQTRRDFAIVVVDNSGQRLVRQLLAAEANVEIIENNENRGFGAAINQVYSRSISPFLAVLNDDAIAAPQWLGGLLDVIESRPDAGMCASQVRLLGSGQIDSAGMLICADGSSKQRGHLRPPEEYRRPEEVLLPSGSAALYRRAMLDEVGGFDEDFFLYCEDTDLGLRARWAGWKCLYAPQAVVDHAYSSTAGRASPLKAYYVERNRLFLTVKNFPVGTLLVAPFVSVVRYGWHVIFMLQGRGAAAQFREDDHGGLNLVAVVIRAHWALIQNWSKLWKKRCEIQKMARLTPREFSQLLRAHAIGAREVAEL